jgi:hypothetical protein
VRRWNPYLSPGLIARVSAPRQASADGSGDATTR